MLAVDNQRLRASEIRDPDSPLSLPSAGFCPHASDAEVAEAPPRGRISPPTERTPELTLIIPAHNEQNRLPATLRKYGYALIERYGNAVEILVVANGCSDATAKVAQELRIELPVIRVVDIQEPIGKGGAILEGFRRARGNAVVFADADGATETTSLLSLVADLDQHDIVIGSRRLAGSRVERKQPVGRRILSRAFNLIVRASFRLPISDTQCGAKAFRLEAARRLAGLVAERNWTFDLDLLLSARRVGFSILERPVVWADVDGSRLKTRSVASAVVASLWRLWRREGAPGIVASTTGDHPPGSSRAMQPQRILALNWRCPSHPEAGGAELNLFEQARRWRRDGHLVTVVCAQRAGDTKLPETEILDGVIVRRMGGRFSVYLHAAWYLVWHGNRYDQILDVANGIPFFSPVFTQTPAVLLVHHVHGSQWFTEFPRPMAAVGWALERYLVPLVYRRRPTIAVSPTTRDALIATGFRPELISVVYNGVSHPPTPIDVVRGGATPNSQTIAYVGRIKRYKRLDLLVAAFAAVRAQFPAARLEIAGDGDARPRLEALIERLGLKDSVTIHGFVDEIAKARILASAAVFATPSMQEGWGLSVIEANLQGCPAVAYDVPGLRSAIVDGETGILAHDDVSFRLALAQLLGNPSLRARMSEAALAWASRFDWEVAAATTLDVLTSCSRREQADRRPLMPAA